MVITNWHMIICNNYNISRNNNYTVVEWFLKTGGFRLLPQCRSMYGSQTNERTVADF